MFDKFMRVMAGVIGTIALFSFLGIMGYAVYTSLQIKGFKAATERQKVMCDCMATQAYMESRKDGV